MVFRKQRCEAILYPLLLTIIFIILLVRSRYGFIWSDEPYYFSEAFRFLKGDAPIADDWYTTQLYSVLLIPFMWLYRLFISPYFMGLFLAFRVGYISLQFMVSLWIYRTFSVKSRQGAFFAALFFLLFCRGNIATLSYYAVETMCLVISQVWIWNRLTVTRASAFRAGCIGLLWGITIICNPYLLILLLTEFLYLSMGERGRLFSRSEKIGLFLGTFSIGIGFVVFLFSRSNLNELMSSLPYIFSDKGYYGNNSPARKALLAFLYIAYRYRATNIFTAIIAIILFGHRIRNRTISPREKSVFFLVSVIILIVNCLYPKTNVYTVGAALGGMMIFGLIVYLLTENRDRKMFGLFWLFGLAASVLMSMASDTRFSAMTQGFLIMSVGTVFLAEDFIGEEQKRVKGEQFKGKKQAIGKNYPWIQGAVTGVFIFASIVLLFDRVTLVYRDSPLYELTETIQDGPMAGIRTTQIGKDEYDTIRSVLVRLRGYRGNLYIMNYLCPWGYLDTDMEVSPYTTWRIFVEEDNQLNQDYYRKHPDKFPDVVLRLSADYPEYDENSADASGNRRRTSDREAAEIEQQWDNSAMIHEIRSRGYREIPVSCGTLYINNTINYSGLSESVFSD